MRTGVPHQAPRKWILGWQLRKECETGAKLISVSRAGAGQSKFLDYRPPIPLQSAGGGGGLPGIP